MYENLINQLKPLGSNSGLLKLPCVKSSTPGLNGNPMNDSLLLSFFLQQIVTISNKVRMTTHLIIFEGTTTKIKISF